MDWAGWALFGLVATAALTVIMIAAQLAGLTRLDLPLVLGTLVTEDPDRARVAGFVIHLAVGQGFALGYAGSFALLHTATWWLGALLGLLHVAVALTVLVPLLVGIHPRMASARAGPGSTAVLEPPGLLALNYGSRTPAVAVVVASGLGTPVLLSEAGVELDHGLDRATLCRQAPDQQGGRQQPAGDLGHHALGQDQAPGGRVPGRLQGRRCRTVAPAARLRPSGGAEAERACLRAADQAAEQGVAVEAGQAQPVDRAAGGHQGGRAGVADQPIVDDRRHAGVGRAGGSVHLSGAAAAGRVRRHRRRGRRWPPPGSACRS